MENTPRVRPSVALIGVDQQARKPCCVAASRQGGQLGCTVRSST
ncbi:Uncharacterised protein [Bordetella pertussis]|nr:Uncharacterised protein [Bordetella pertussis]CFP64801.1 Uncharacterised protein [Bordetella pertussis]